MDFWQEENGKKNKLYVNLEISCRILRKLENINLFSVFGPLLKFYSMEPEFFCIFIKKLLIEQTLLN